VRLVEYIKSRVCASEDIMVVSLLIGNVVASRF